MPAKIRHPLHRLPHHLQILGRNNLIYDAVHDCGTWGEDVRAATSITKSLIINYNSRRNIDGFEILTSIEGIVADGFKLTIFPENHFFETGRRKRASPDFCYTGRETYHLQLFALSKYGVADNFEETFFLED